MTAKQVEELFKEGGTIMFIMHLAARSLGEENSFDIGYEDGELLIRSKTKDATVFMKHGDNGYVVARVTGESKLARLTRAQVVSPLD